MPRAVERRESILRAAAGAFVARGFTATSMDDVATAAGISRLVVYRHFPSKEALYVAVLERVSNRLGEAFTAQLAVEDRSGRAAVAAAMAVGREDPAAFTLLWRHAAREPQFAEHAEAFRERAVAFASGLLAPALGARRGRTGGPGRRTRRDQAEQRWAAETVVTYVIGGVLHWLEFGTAGGDADLVARISSSLPAMVLAWAEADRTSVRYTRRGGRAEMEAG